MLHFVIGLGSIGCRHAENLIKMGEKVIGLDPAYNTGRHHFSWPLVDELDQGWQQDPDMIWICGPTHLHGRQAIKALQHGKHVFIEKPVAYDLQSATGLLSQYRLLADKPLAWVACNLRFHPAVRIIREILGRKVIGRPLIYRSHFSHFLPNMRPGVDYRKIYAARASQGGGIILDDIHDIDLALWFNGPVKAMKSMRWNSNMLEMDAEDMANITLRHANGVMAELHMDFLRQDKSRGIEIIGEKGSLEWRSRFKTPEICRVRLICDGRDELIYETKENCVDMMFTGQLEEIFSALKSCRFDEQNLLQAVSAMKIAENARSSDDSSG